MKNNLKKFVNSKYFPFFILFIVIFIMHLFMYSNSDDDFFRVQLDNYNLIDYLKMRYNTWSSRIFVEILFVFITRLPLILWSIIDTTIFTFMGITLSKIFNTKKKQNWLIIGLLMLLPYKDMASAGYVCTTIAYLWTSASLIYNLYIVKKILTEEKINIFENILSIILLLITISFEQTLCLLLGFIGLAICYVIYKKKFNIKKQFALYLYFFISIGMLIFTLTCPGNDLRTLAEIETWYPQYAEFGLLSKTYLGIITMLNVFLNNGIILQLFSLILCFCIFSKYNNTILRTFSIIQLVIFVFFGPLKNILLLTFPSIERLLVIMGTYNVVPELHYNYLIPLIFSCLLFIICTVLVYFAFDKKLFAPILFLASLAARFIMGFSPTVFASVERTAFFSYIGIIILIYILINKISYNKIRENIKYGITVLSIFNILNIVYTLIIVRG